ncbi:YtxH domain-containing protein [Fulvivirga maritima]|uniref:YtxH domain-containing protein n=1 Tax=Fulvivirga maritima TaxID=2904247 RepID=UPI001F3A6BDA|nr:YtxH domain-containing protein [Fulvivirga maritima]UII28467.1 YtxH domain-containing protein [Fulvivirga maritima]
MDNGNLKFLAGLAAGMGIGTVLGVLLAPEKGSETYKKIEGTVKDVANDLVNFGAEKAKLLKQEAEKVTK